MTIGSGEGGARLGCALADVRKGFGEGGVMGQLASLDDSDTGVWGPLTMKTSSGTSIQLLLPLLAGLGVPLSVLNFDSVVELRLRMFGVTGDQSWSKSLLRDGAEFEAGGGGGTRSARRVTSKKDDERSGSGEMSRVSRGVLIGSESIWDGEESVVSRLRCR